MAQYEIPCQFILIQTYATNKEAHYNHKGHQLIESHYVKLFEYTYAQNS